MPAFLVFVAVLTTVRVFVRSVRGCAFSLQSMSLDLLLLVTNIDIRGWLMAFEFLVRLETKVRRRSDGGDWFRGVYCGRHS